MNINQICFSELKARLIELKVNFFNDGLLSPKESLQLHDLGFRSVEESSIYDTVKRNWHECNWLFYLVITLFSALLMLSQLVLLWTS